MLRYVKLPEIAMWFLRVTILDLHNALHDIAKHGPHPFPMV